MAKNSLEEGRSALAHCACKPTISMRLVSILDDIRAGDVLIVLRLDPEARTRGNGPRLIHELEERDASLRMLEPAIDTGGPMGRMVLTILGMVAEMEVDFIRDHRHAGFDAGKAKGISRTVPPLSTARTVSPRKEGMGATEIAEAVGSNRGLTNEMAPAVSMTTSVPVGRQQPRGN
jgi:DNA invertase Pin-like site-specific DNA recombinase